MRAGNRASAPAFPQQSMWKQTSRAAPMRGLVHLARSGSLPSARVANVTGVSVRHSERRHIRVHSTALGSVSCSVNGSQICVPFTHRPKMTVTV